MLTFNTALLYTKSAGLCNLSATSSSLRPSLHYQKQLLEKTGELWNNTLPHSPSVEKATDVQAKAMPIKGKGFPMASFVRLCTLPADPAIQPTHLRACFLLLSGASWSLSEFWSPFFPLKAFHMIFSFSIDFHLFFTYSGSIKNKKPPLFLFLTVLRNFIQ